MSKPFKVRYQGRILAIGKNYLTSFDVFQKEVAKRFGLNEQSLLFNYVDDEGDNIELMNEDDFETYNGIEKKSIIDVKIFFIFLRFKKLSPSVNAKGDSSKSILFRGKILFSIVVNPPSSGRGCPTNRQESRTDQAPEAQVP